jgi:hypothetical protein
MAMKPPPMKPPWHDEYPSYFRDQERMRGDFFEAKAYAAFVSAKPRYTTYAIPPPPEAYLVSFIGGPKNGTQEYLTRHREFNGIVLESQMTWTFLLTAPFSPNLPEDTATLEYATYRFTVIPQSETPFSDIPCVVAIYQG